MAAPGLLTQRMALSGRTLVLHCPKLCLDALPLTCKATQLISLREVLARPRAEASLLDFGASFILVHKALLKGRRARAHR